MATPAILDFRLGRNLKKTKPWVQLANSQSKIQNPKSKIGTARNLGIDLVRLGRRRLTAVARGWVNLLESVNGSPLCIFP